MPKKTSIIMVAYDQDEFHRMVTAVAIQNIERFTDEEDYELILIDQKPWDSFTKENAKTIWKKFHFETIDKYEIVGDIGVSAAWNKGADMSDGEYLCFIHSDVFFYENWLPRLRGYLERNERDVVMPGQGAISRKMMKEWEAKPYFDKSYYDAGVIFMRKRDFFEKTQKFDEEMKVLSPGGIFVGFRLGNLSWDQVSDVVIGHIGSYMSKPSEERQKIETRENVIIKNKYTGW